MKLSGNTILITGGGSGIGRELALRFHDLGNKVIVAGRRREALKETGLASVPLVGAPTYSATKAAIHSYTLSLRAALAGAVEVIELIPPGVQTELTPGQLTRGGYMPLGDYIDEVMALFAVQPTPPEIAVERVRFLRNAEAENRFPQTFAMLNSH